MNRKIGRIGSIAVIGLLLMAIAMAAPAEAVITYDLKIAPNNLQALQSLTYGNAGLNAWYTYGVGNIPRMLKYDYSNTLNTYGRSKTVAYIGSMKAINIGGGQCVAFVNALSDRNTKSAYDWERGNSVMSGGVAPGTLIATFMSNGKYDAAGDTGNNHVAIFDSYILLQGPNIANRIAGFRVWDQNFISSYVVGMHSMYQSTSYKSNAYNYYVVKGP